MAVRTDLGDIEVIGAAPGARDIEVTALRRGIWRLPEVEQRREGDRLVVEGRCRDAWHGSCATDLVLRVPHGLSVRAHSEVGEVTVRGPFTDVSMESSTGDLRAERVHARSVTAVTSVGDIDVQLRAPADAVDASSSVGDITLVVPDDGTAYDVDMRSDVGDRHTDVPRDAGSPHTIRAGSSVGDVRVVLEDDGAP